MQLARVVVRVLVLADVVCVMLVVLIARVDVVHAVDTVFVAIFCSWRCTLYIHSMTRRFAVSASMLSTAAGRKVARPMQQLLPRFHQACSSLISLADFSVVWQSRISQSWLRQTFNGFRRLD